MNSPLDPAQVLAVLRSHMAGRDRLNLRILAKALAAPDRVTRAALESDALAELVRGDDRLAAALEEYKARPKGRLPGMANALGSGLKGSIDEVRAWLRGGAVGETVEDFNGSIGHDTHGPTDALPGTPEKVAVLASRYARRVELHHPLDARRPLGASATEARFGEQQSA